jgi:hypothetical protein
VSRLARIVYVSNGRGDTVTPIAAATGTPGPPIPVGPAPGEIVVTPDGKTAYITTDDPVVVPIATATNTAGPPIRIGVNRPGLSDKPVAIAITPDGNTAYAVRACPAAGVDRGRDRGAQDMEGCHREPRGLRRVRGPWPLSCLARAADRKAPRSSVTSRVRSPSTFYLCVLSCGHSHA